MKTSIEFDLKLFSQDLQHDLRSTFACNALCVKYDLDQGTLKLLIQHPNVESLRGAVFSGIHRGLKRLLPAHVRSFGDQSHGAYADAETCPEVNAGIATLHVYCQIAGEHRPYLAKVISVQKLLRPTHRPMMPLSPPNSVHLSVGSTSQSPGQMPPSQTLRQVSSMSASAEADALRADASNQASNHSSNNASEHASKADRSDLDDEATSVESSIESSSKPSNSKPSKLWPLLSRHRWKQLKMAAMGTLAIASSLVLYGVTRPCVIGSCSVIGEAEHIGQEAVKLLQEEPSAEDVVIAYDRMIDINYRLGSIPFWSPYYDQAQLLLNEFQADADRVAQIVSAQRIARQAAITTQNPPHPIQVWRQVRAEWHEAIAQLEGVSDDIMVDGLVQRKLSEYNAHLAQVNQRIQEEKQAQEKVASARDAVQLAEAREGVARSLESWQQVHVTWQVVMNRLAEVPEQTMAYAEAQQLSAIYQSRLKAAQERKVREELSSSTYTEAVSSAEQAMALERSGQWSEAVAHWQKALNHVRQVPKETSYFDQAQSLLNAYSDALEQAEKQMTTELAVEQVRPMLEQSCQAAPDLCTFALATDEISIYIGSRYDASVQQVMLSGSVPVASNYGGEAAKAASLLQAIADAGNRSQVPVAVYGSAGSLLGTYKPEFQGYVQPQLAASAEQES